MKVSVYTKDIIKNKETISSLKDMISKYGFEINEAEPDIVFFIGGDGTLLRAINKYLDKIERINFIGINEGSLGFLCNFEKEELSTIFEMLKNNELVISYICFKNKKTKQKRKIFL